MSLAGKNRAIYSYNNKDEKEKSFIYKDFEKSNSYHSNFSGTRFIGTSLRASKMKYCDFSKCVFDGVDFAGTNLKGSKFYGAHFSDCIFVSTVFKKTNFKKASFEHCFMLGCKLDTTNGIIPTELNGVTVLSSMPLQSNLPMELIDIIQELRNNDMIRRSRTLHGKNNRINTFTVMLLHEHYSYEELMKYLPVIPELVTTQFYTVSYLKKLLKKVQSMGTI